MSDLSSLVQRADVGVVGQLWSSKISQLWSSENSQLSDQVSGMLERMEFDQKTRSMDPKFPVTGRWSSVRSVAFSPDGKNVHSLGWSRSATSRPEPRCAAMEGLRWRGHLKVLRYSIWRGDFF